MVLEDERKDKTPRPLLARDGVFHVTDGACVVAVLKFKQMMSSL
jgi:hypothetical protein